MAVRKKVKSPARRKAAGKKRPSRRTVDSISGEGSRQAVPEYALCDLLLDARNPRLGGQFAADAKQATVLDTVVEIFGIDDVLSSIAVNGYFDAEPLVGVREPKTKQIRIIEGNRRLAACLILAGDKRARNQKKRTDQYQDLQEKHGQAAVREVPVLLHDSREGLLSYLGVRHIAAAQPWDSYAKAAWVADLLEESSLTLQDVSEMIGDQHRTVARILEGYYLVNQLIEKGRFTPAQSFRSGRGSNPDYPFSWIYTALGHRPIRNWLELDDLTEGPKKTAVRRKNLDDAGQLLSFLFGDKNRRQNAAISDSRQISDLAKAIADPESRQLLKRGKALEEVEDLGKPAKERITDGLYQAQDSLQSVVVLLSEREMDTDEASELLNPSGKVRNLALQVHKKIRSAVIGTDDENGDDA